MNVTKRSGKVEQYNEKKITKNAKRACKGLDDTDPNVVVMNAQLKLYEGVTTNEIDESLIKSACGLIEQEPNYRFVAARLLLGTIYKEVFGEGVDSDAFDYQYRQSFLKNLKELIKTKILREDLKTLDLKKIAQALKPERDFQFAYIGLQTAKDRYLIKKEDKLLESPQAWLMRVAMGLAIAEKEEDRTEWAIKFYDKLSSFDYMTSTPTLFYSGNVRNQLSSCFLSTFEDSIYGIFDGLHQEAQKSKFAGGLGMDFTPFRAGGAYINGTNGYTQGSVYFWKLFNDMLVAVQQGGRRQGAGCGYLETWHADIEDFLELRKNVGEDRRRTHDMNTANWIPDLFIKQVNCDGDWYLFSPDETPELHDLFGVEFEKKYNEYVAKGKRGELRIFKHTSAKELWKKMLKMIFETSSPWITFKDPCNIRYTNQHEGVVHSSNLCLAGDTKIYLSNKSGNVKFINELEQLYDVSVMQPVLVSNMKVLSYNTKTKEAEYKRILNIIQTSRSAKVLNIQVDNTELCITCTPDHEIYTNRGYVAAKDLTPDDQLRIYGHGDISASGTKLIITEQTEEIPVYDITVEDNHNFFANNILVHNCTEITLATKATTYEANNDRKIKEYGETAVCNLGSVNLANHIDSQGNINYDKLAETIEVGARMLDNVIDINFYPTQEAKKSNKRHRPVGMGSMGWADVFLKKKIAYDSDAAINLSDELYEFMSFHSILASSELAAERGKYDSYEGSLWSKGVFPIDTYNQLMTSHRDTQHNIKLKSSELDWDGLRRHVKEFGMRNSNTMAIAPTACQLGTNRIQTEDGVKSIYDILKDNDVDYSAIEASNTQQWIDVKPFNVPTLEGINQCDKVWFNGVQPTFDIEFEDGSIYTYTENHKLLVLRGTKELWVEVRNLKESDEIVTIMP